jgi:hypothetical protein
MKYNYKNKKLCLVVTGKAKPRKGAYCPFPGSAMLSPVSGSPEGKVSFCLSSSPEPDTCDACASDADV